MSILNKLFSKFSNAPVEPVAQQPASSVIMGDTVTVKFGFGNPSTAAYDPNQTYHAFASEQAKAQGQSLQTDNAGKPTYTAQFIVNGAIFVVDPNLTFAELNSTYNVTPETPAEVVIPDPERPAGRLG